MIKFDVGYVTSTRHQMIMNVEIHSLIRERMPILPYEDIKQYCGDCGGYNGGCPGFSPYFPMIRKSMNYATVMIMDLDMAWPCMYSKGGRARGLVGANYFRMGYADMITDKMVWRILNSIHNPSTYYTLGCGHCPSCSKKDCGPLRDRPCIKPKKRRYSMESTGIDCNATVNILRGEDLLWWYKTAELPVKMTRVATIVSDNPQTARALVQDAIMSHPYTVPIDKITMPKLELNVVKTTRTSELCGFSRTQLEYNNLELQYDQY